MCTLSINRVLGRVPLIAIGEMPRFTSAWRHRWGSPVQVEEGVPSPFKKAKKEFFEGNDVTLFGIRPNNRIHVSDDVIKQVKGLLACPWL